MGEAGRAVMVALGYKLSLKRLTKPVKLSSLGQLLGGPHHPQIQKPTFQLGSAVQLPTSPAATPNISDLTPLKQFPSLAPLKNFSNDATAMQQLLRNLAWMMDCSRVRD